MRCLPGLSGTVCTNVTIPSDSSLERGCWWCQLHPVYKKVSVSGYLHFKMHCVPRILLRHLMNSPCLFTQRNRLLSRPTDLILKCVLDNFPPVVQLWQFQHFNGNTNDCKNAVTLHNRRRQGFFVMRLKMFVSNQQVCVYLFEIEEEAWVLPGLREEGEKHCDTDEEHRGVLAHFTQRLLKEQLN